LIASKAAKAKGAERKQRMDTSRLMEQVLSKDNLNAAYLQVVRNKGAAGVDGMTVEELGEYLSENAVEKFKAQSKRLTGRSWGVSNAYKVKKLNSLCKSLWILSYASILFSA